MRAPSFKNSVDLPRARRADVRRTTHFEHSIVSKVSAMRLRFSSAVSSALGFFRRLCAGVERRLEFASRALDY